VHEGLRRRLGVPGARFRRGGPAAVLWVMRLTVAAVASYVVASALFPRTQPLLAPLTALLVVQVTPVSLLASGLDRVVSVVAGVSLAVAFSAVVPLAWWSLGVLIAVSIMIGQALRLRSNLIEVAISGMLVLGVGSVGAGSAAGQRVTETLVGAFVGIAANLLFPPKVAAGDAGRAIKDLADDLDRLLTRAADELADREPTGVDVAAQATTWLDDARRITHDMPQVGAALLRAEQSRTLNVRALGTPNAGPGLRQGLEALEHTSVTVRAMFRAVHDATYDPTWPDDEVGAAVLANLEHVLRDLGAAISAFGELVRAEAAPAAGDVTAEVDRVNDALEGLHEARARLTDLLMMETAPVVFELHVSLLSSVKRLLSELDLGERSRRRSRLRRPPRVLLPENIRRRPPIIRRPRP
jgi:fusaric acid resistance family protein